MGATLWGCRQRKARGSFLQDGEDKNGNLDLATSIIKFVKQRWMWAAKKKRKRILHLHLQEKKQRLVTLEEWILASPSLNRSFTDDGNCRVHPSFDRIQEGCLNKSREDLNMERDKKLVEEARAVVDYSSSCRRQSDKIKKKVTFRLPKVADIFILDSPEGHFENV